MGRSLLNKANFSGYHQLAFHSVMKLFSFIGLLPKGTMKFSPAEITSHSRCAEVFGDDSCARTAGFAERVGRDFCQQAPARQIKARCDMEAG